MAVPASSMPRLGDYFSGAKWLQSSMEQAGRRMLQDAAREDGGLSDMEFVLDSGARIRGHKAWLTARCEYMRGMMSGWTKEGKTGIVPVRECGEEAFHAILEFLYAGRLVSGKLLGRQGQEELLGLADLFGIKDEMEASLAYTDAASIFMRTLRICQAQRWQTRVMEEAGRRMLEDAREGGELSDMEFTLDSGRTIRGHMAWLMARSEHIRDTMSSLEGGGKFSMYVRGCLDREFVELLEFLYTGKIGRDMFSGLDRDDRERMWILADSFHVKADMEVSLLSHAISWANAEEAARIAGEIKGVPLDIIAKAADRCVEALPSEPVDRDEGRRVMRVIGSLYDVRNDWPDLGKKVGAILVSMRACAGDTPELKMGCAALTSAVREKDRLLAVKEGAIEVIVGALQAHGDDDEVQKAGCEALLNLCEYFEGKRRAGAAGVVEVIVRALEFHRADVEFQLLGCRALGIICDTCTENKVRVWAARGIEAVVGALKAHEADAKVQQEGTGSLVRIYPTWFNAEIEVSAPQVVDAVVDALKSHTSDAQVTENAFKILSLLCMQPRFGEQAISSGGFEIIAEVLRVHIANDRVVIRGMEAMSDICIDPERHHRNREAGGVDAVVEVLRAHRGNARVQRCGCRTLWNVHGEGYDREQMIRVAEAGGVEAVVEALTTHSADPKVIMYGSAALAVICDCVENKRRAAAAGGVEAVVEALKWLKLHDGDLEEDVACFCFGALMTFCFNGEHHQLEVEAGGVITPIPYCAAAEENRRRAGAAGGIEAVVGLLQLHRNDEEIQENGCGCLENLTYDHEENQRRAGAAGSVEVLLEALKSFRGNSSIQSSCCGALENLCLDVENRKRAKEQGDEREVELAMSSHREDANVQRDGRAALANLAL